MRTSSSNARSSPRLARSASAVSSGGRPSTAQFYTARGRAVPAVKVPRGAEAGSAGRVQPPLANDGDGACRDDDEPAEPYEQGKHEGVAFPGAAHTRGDGRGLDQHRPVREL